MSGQVLLRDLVDIPEAVHAGDFVLALAKGVDDKSTIDSYVVTPQLAENFDRALELVKTALEGRSSHAAYLDGSFGSGKSHFMAVLYAILNGDPDARGKKGLADIVARHDSWLQGRKFLLVPYHLPDSQTLDAAILGGYVDYVLTHFPGTPLPAVYRDDELLADAREQRERIGDDAFIAQLPVGDSDWGTPDWDVASLDGAFSQPPGGLERRRLIGDLLAGPFKRYARAVRGDQESFISLDEGLSVISTHAKEVLGRDAIVLLLDELVLWLAGYVGDPRRISLEAQKVSKLVEAGDLERPAPIVSFVPRQRDLRDLVRKDSYGAETTSLFDTLKYWDGRFDTIRMDDRNLPAIVHERLLKPKDDAAARALDEAFAKSATVPAQTWQILLDTHGERGTKDDFRQTYPFSPAFTHAMVDISGALQRQRTALKLMQQLLVDYRDILPVGQLMPLGAIFDVLARGTDRPFTDKLRTEFEEAKAFYKQKLRPYLLQRHGLTEAKLAEISPRHNFHAADLVAKTLLLAALVPNVPALNGLTATRLAALNHGSIVSMLPNQERSLVTRTLKELSAQFGEVRLSGNDDDPRVDLALIGVDTDGIIRDNAYADDEGARRRTVRELLWEELGISDKGTLDTRTEVIWRGTARTVTVVMENVRDDARVPVRRFQPEVGTISVVIDYPFDEGNHSPADDVNRVHKLQAQLSDLDTLIWLPHFLSEERIGDLSTLIIINHLLERDRLAQATPTLTADDRHHARTQMESRRGALTAQLREALHRAYGVHSQHEADLGALVSEQVMTLAHGFEPRLPIGQSIGDAFQRLCRALLDHRYPTHPDFDPNARSVALKPTELNLVIEVVDQAAQDKVGRHEVMHRGDVATLKKIANPLKIGVMHEQAFVLSHEWPDLISRRAAGKDELQVRDIRSWINDAQPGLPLLVQNLLVICYSIQADKAWFRAGQPRPIPKVVTDVSDDMSLRGQELPDEPEFERASERAHGIFGVARQPVRSTRSVQSLARSVQDRADTLRQSSEDLERELGRHAQTLGLGPDDPRMVTVRLAAGLLADLGSAPDSTAALRALAAADLPRENAIYSAHLKGAEKLTSALRSRNWQVLDDIAARADVDGNPEAVAVITALREAARRDEHEVALAEPLIAADNAALDLMMRWTRKPEQSVPRPSSGRPPGPPEKLLPVPDDPSLRTRINVDANWDVRQGAPGIDRGPVIPARDVPGLLETIRAAAEANPDADFEITWRIV